MLLSLGPIRPYKLGLSSDHRGVLLKVFNDIVPGIGVECVCLSGAMLPPLHNPFSKSAPTSSRAGSPALQQTHHLNSVHREPSGPHPVPWSGALHVHACVLCSGRMVPANFRPTSKNNIVCSGPTDCVPVIVSAACSLVTGGSA